MRDRLSQEGTCQHTTLAFQNLLNYLYCRTLLSALFTALSYNQRTHNPEVVTRKEAHQNYLRLQANAERLIHSQILLWSAPNQAEIDDRTARKGGS